MKSPVPRIFFLLASSLLICSCFLSAGVSAKTDFVDEICKGNEEYSYEDCVSALAADPESRTAKNLKQLVRIVLNLAITNTTSIQDYIKQQVQKGGSTAFKQCVDCYDLSIGNFRIVLREIDEDPLTASYDAKIATDYAVECSSDMMAAGVHDAVIASGNNYIQLFSNIAIAIIDRLPSVSRP